MTSQPISPLIADIIAANTAQLAATTNTLIDSLTAQRDDAIATLAAVRSAVETLLNGQYQPSSAAVMRALYPPQEIVDQYRRVGEVR